MATSTDLLRAGVTIQERYKTTLQIKSTNDNILTSALRNLHVEHQKKRKLLEHYSLFFNSLVRIRYPFQSASLLSPLLDIPSRFSLVTGISFHVQSLGSTVHKGCEE